MRRLMTAVLLAGALTLVSLGTAFGHVHGVTPLNCAGVPNNPNAGALATDGTPADDANGGPIVGLIPRDTGESVLLGGDGGRNSSLCD